MTENFPTPAWWSFYGTKYFGTWSAKKAALICELANIDRELWMETPNIKANFTEGTVKFAGVFVHRWLAQQDPVILDENNLPMKMGKDSER